MEELFVTSLSQPRPHNGPHHGEDRDYEYIEWKKKVNLLTTLNSYFSKLFLVMHPLVMIIAYDFWANYHYLLVAHSLLQMMLGSFIWALPDPKYQYWLKN